MAKRKKSRGFTDLSFTKQELAKNSHAVVAKVGYHILLRVKHRTAVNSVYALKVLAKGQKVKSIKKVVGFKTKSMIKTVKRKAKTAGRRAKTGITKRTRNKIYRKRNGRTIQKSKKVFITKTGQPYIKLATGQTRFVKR
jgi:hypothetical protein